MAAIHLTSHLARKLRESREASGLSRSALAGRGGCTSTDVRNAEVGRGPASTYVRLAEAVAIKVDARSLPPGAHIGARLRAQRERRGLTVSKIATAAGIDAVTVRCIERGELGALQELEAFGRALHARLTLVPADGSLTFYGSAATSSAKDDWQTPADFLGRMTEALGEDFDLDPCSPGATRSRVPARVHYTREDDGLRHPWRGRVFMNPPYGRGIEKWVAKARAEVESGNAILVIGLVPARVDTAWWHDDVARCSDLWFLRGRLRFGAGQGTAPFPSAIVAWGARSSDVERIARAWPHAFYIPAAHRLLESRIARLVTGQPVEGMASIC